MAFLASGGGNVEFVQDEFNLEQATDTAKQYD